MTIPLDLLTSATHLITNAEGLSLKLYKDSQGIYSIGYGRNLEANGISKEEALLLFRNDLNKVYDFLSTNYPFFNSLTVPRQCALLSMAFQLGEKGFSSFKRTLKALEEQKWNEASEYMLESKWASQTPNRARQTAEIIRRGKL